MVYSDAGLVSIISRRPEIEDNLTCTAFTFSDFRRASTIEDSRKPVVGRNWRDRARGLAYPQGQGAGKYKRRDKSDASQFRHR